MLTDEQAESLAQQLEANLNYRVLRLLAPPSVFAEPDGRPLAKGVIVDTETTGLSQDMEKIIEIGLVVYEYDPETGQAYRVLESFGALEDPGIPITPEISEITGITNEMVAGKRIDDARFAELVSAASIVIAHNAKFDRPFLEQRLAEAREWDYAFSTLVKQGRRIGIWFVATAKIRSSQLKRVFAKFRFSNSDEATFEAALLA